MGSGSNIKKAIKKYGINCFIKEIIKFFNTSEEKYLYEKQFINKSLLQNPLCYNIMEGGYAFPDGWFKVKDKNGNISLTTKDDPKYLSGELVRATTDTILMFDINGNKKMIPCSKFKDYYNLQWRPKYFYSYMNKTKKFLERDVPENYKFSTYNFKTRLYKLHKEYNIPLPH